MSMSKPVMEISHSSAMQVDSCMRKYQIRKRFQWPDNSDREDSLAAMAGRAIHVYLQTLYAGGTDNDAHLAFLMEWDFSIEATAKPLDIATRGFEPSLFTCHYLARQLNPNYSRIAKVDLSHLDLTTNDTALTAAIEVKFNIILSHSRWKHDYHYRGLIDLIEYDAHYDLFTVTDIKTHRSKNPETEHRYKYSTQTVPYGLVVEAMNGNTDLTAMGKLSFQTRYLSAYIDLSAPRLDSFTFDKTEDDVHNWLKASALRIESMESVADWPVWPRSESGCDAYGRPCAFYNKHCIFEEPAALQDYITGFNELTPQRSFGEWFTLNIDLTAIWP